MKKSSKTKSKPRTKPLGKSLNQKKIVSFSDRLHILNAAIKQISEGDPYMATGLMMNQLDNMLKVAHEDNHEWLEVVPYTKELRALLGKIREAVAKHITHNQIN